MEYPSRQQKGPKCSTGVQSKNDTIISAHFQGTPLNTLVIQVYAQPLMSSKLQLNGSVKPQETFWNTKKKKDVFFIIGDWNAKSSKSRDTWSNRQVWLWSIKWSRAKALSREFTGHSKHLLSATQETTLYTDITRWPTTKSLQSKMEKLYTVSKTRPGVNWLTLKLKLQYSGHLVWRADSRKRPWCWERLRAGGEGGDRMRWLDGTTDSTDVSLSPLQQTEKVREAWRVAVRGVTNLAGEQEHTFVPSAKLTVS